MICCILHTGVSLIVLQRKVFITIIGFHNVLNKTVHENYSFNTFTVIL